MALRRSGCDSPWLHHLELHNRPRARGRQQSAPFGSARYSGQHRGARPFQFRQSVGSDARRWYRRETGATPVGGFFSPVAQSVERPTLDREVDGANPSGAATHGRAHRAASCAGRSIADRRTDIAEQAGQNRPGASFQQRSRSSMYRAPRFERGGCRRNSCREHHSLPRRSPTAEATSSDLV